MHYRNVKRKYSRDVLKKKKDLNSTKILSKLAEIRGVYRELRGIKNYTELGRVFLAVERLATNLARLKKELFDEIYDTQVYTIVERVMYSDHSAGMGGS